MVSLAQVSGRFRCAECPGRFKSNAALVAHRRTHKGDQGHHKAILPSPPSDWTSDRRPHQMESTRNDSGLEMTSEKGINVRRRI